MPYFATSQEWLQQSALLLEARPSTTRITTKYHLTDRSGSSKKRQKRRQQARLELQQQQQSSTSTSTSTPTPRASLTLKTFDPHSGTCLKYRTTKAAEVSRLVLSLGQLGRTMAALPTDSHSDVVMADVAATAEDVGTPGVEKGEASGGAASGGGKIQSQSPAPQQQSGGGGGGGGKGKKKRGKK
ncbi:hypothetical protein F4777DRAFT_574298 [Nemania sp. FL0916]|nr:hypothetical protein F4777DRAFT_574298 [Nemania sp. FL0916]